MSPAPIRPTPHKTNKMASGQNVKTINPRNSAHSYLLARVDPENKNILTKPGTNGYLIDRNEDVIELVWRGSQREIDSCATKLPRGRIYKFANVFVRQLPTFSRTSLLSAKELSLDGATVEPIPAKDLPI